MVKVSIEGDKRFLQDLEKYAKQVDSDAGNCVVDFAKLGGIELIRQTEPFGLAGKQKSMLENAASRDIAKVYQATGKVIREIQKLDRRKAAIYSGLVREGKLQKAEDVARSVLGRNYDVVEFDGGSKHKEQRNQQGKIDTPKDVVALTNYSAVSPYHDKKRLAIGYVKSGWYAAIAALKGSIPKRLQKWITGHGTGHGTASTSKTGINKEVTITNNVDYVSNLLTDAKISKAIRYAMNAVVRKYQKIIDSRSL
jgi:hypothetical protein